MHFLETIIKFYLFIKQNRNKKSSPQPPLYFCTKAIQQQLWNKEKKVYISSHIGRQPTTMVEQHLWKQLLLLLLLWNSVRPSSCQLWHVAIFVSVVGWKSFFCFSFWFYFFCPYANFASDPVLESAGVREWEPDLNIFMLSQHLPVIITFGFYFVVIFFFPTKVCGFLRNIHKPRIIKGPSFYRRGIMGSVFFSFKPWIIASFFVWFFCFLLK